jgi:hypothetical protein
LNLLEGVAAIRVHFAVGWHNFDRFLISLRCGEGHGQESDCEDLWENITKLKLKFDRLKLQGKELTHEFHFFWYGMFCCSSEDSWENCVKKIPVLTIFYILQVPLKNDSEERPSNKQQQNILFVFRLEASLDMEMSERENWQTP